MKKVVGIILTLVFLLPGSGWAADQPDEARKWTPFQLSLWNPVQVFSEERDVVGFRSSLLYGKNQDVYWLDVGPGFNKTHHMFGLQVSGVVNFVEGEFIGLQTSGLINFVNEQAQGVQLAGIVNANKKDMIGIQFAGFANTARDVDGFQIAFVTNGLADLFGFQDVFVQKEEEQKKDSQKTKFSFVRNVTGAQIAVGANASQNITGAQLAYVGNIVEHKVTGVQFSHLINVAMEEVTGVQVGAVNYAKKVRGAQIGLINYCESMTGLQVGFLNIIKNGMVPFFPIANFSQSL